MKIDLTQLRAYAESIRLDDAEVSPPVLLALIDAAEAAHEAIDDGIGSMPDCLYYEVGSKQFDALKAALACFTFEQP